MQLKNLLFQFVFYTGSWIPSSKYSPFINKLEKASGIRNTEFKTPFTSPVKNNNQSILIGHSLGGYFALRDAIAYPDKVAGVVLINSHFNSRGVMPYPRIPIRNVAPPVLTLLAARDERLSVHKALDDAWECFQEKYSDKYFIVNKGFNHFTGITETDQQDKLLEPVIDFINDIQTRNFTKTRSINYDTRRLSMYTEPIESGSVITSNSVNVIDAIFNIVMPPFIWRFGHYLWFLTTKPDEHINYLFQDDNHIYLKGKPQDDARFKIGLQECMRDTNISSEFLDIDLPAIHPSILSWLLLPLFPLHIKDTIVVPRMVLKVNKNTTYYKVPNPRKILPILPTDTLLDS